MTVYVEPVARGIGIRSRSQAKLSCAAPLGTPDWQLRWLPTAGVPWIEGCGNTRATSADTAVVKAALALLYAPWPGVSRKF